MDISGVGRVYKNSLKAETIGSQTRLSARNSNSMGIFGGRAKEGSSDTMTPYCRGQVHFG